MEAVTSLLDRGAAIDMQNKAGDTAALASAQEGHLDIYR